MSSRSLAAARSRRAGDPVPPISGNRPITSINSQAAFVNNGGYPVPPTNVRLAKQPPPQPQQRGGGQRGPPPQQQPQQQYYEQPTVAPSAPPFSKLSISDAIGLITLRLGRIEQWVIDTDAEEREKEGNSSDGLRIPDNHKIIDNSVLASIINRLDSIEKNNMSSTSSSSNENIAKLSEQFERMSDTVNKHTIELSKCSEQVFRFNRELVETKDILKSFMVKYDVFVQHNEDTFADYEVALADLEKRLPVEEGSLINDIDESVLEGEDVADASMNIVDLKSLVKQQLANELTN